MPNNSVSNNNVKQQSLAPLGWREKIGYGLGDMGFNFYWQNISAFLLIYYTDVFGISAAAAGTMMLVTKIVDAFTDPAMGALADRTKTRFGKFRPYLLWAAIPMAAAGVLTYTTPDLSEGGKLIWAYGTYTIMMLTYTVLSIPYSALSGVITANSQERTTLISFRFIAAFSGGIIVAYFTPKLVVLLGQGDEALGWQLTMLVFGIAAAILFSIVFLTTRERIEPPTGQKTPVVQDLKDLAGNKPWLVLFCLALIIMVTITMRMGTGFYYFKYYVERPELIGSFLSVYMFALAAGAASTPLMTKFIDKKQLMVLLMGIVGVLSIAFYFVPKDAIWLMFALQAIIGFALGPKSPLAFSMYADTADYNEWRTGRRATAMTFSAATFSQKLGGAIASAAIGWILAAMGYIANQAQSDASQMGIVLLMTVIPGVIALLAALVMRFYRLNNEELAKIQLELLARKEQQQPAI